MPAHPELTRPGPARPADLPEQLRQEDGSRERYQRFFNEMDQDGSKTIECGGRARARKRTRARAWAPSFANTRTRAARASACWHARGREAAF